MKKIMVIILSVFFALPVAFSQEADSKKKEKKDYTDIMPQKGDFAIGIDMANMIKFIGNSFSSNGTNSPGFDMIESSQNVAIEPTLFGKYFLTDKSALRVRFGLGINNYTTRVFVHDDVENFKNPLGDNDLTEIKTVDQKKFRSTAFDLGIGYEYRRSLWRVQGYVGGEVIIGYGYEKTAYTYGNAMSETNEAPTTVTDYNRTSNTFGATSNDSRRVLSAIGDKYLDYGAAVFVGADLFLSRNISIGAEFQLAGIGTHYFETTNIVEEFKFDKVYTAETTIGAKSSAFKIVPRGFLNLTVHF